MVRVRAIQTGYARLRPAQARRRAGGALRVLVDRDWKDWMPIHAWLIEHLEGNILVDTGETANVALPGYLPGWHPFFRLAASFRASAEDELGPQLNRAGIASQEIRTVVLTHLHTDHVNGLKHLSLAARFFAARGEIESAKGRCGQAMGYLAHHWPAWFRPEPIEFEERRFGPFERQLSLSYARSLKME